jgi:hypothetical protein
LLRASIVYLCPAVALILAFQLFFTPMSLDAAISLLLTAAAGGALFASLLVGPALCRGTPSRGVV